MNKILSMTEFFHQERMKSVKLKESHQSNNHLTSNLLNESEYKSDEERREEEYEILSDPSAVKSYIPDDMIDGNLPSAEGYDVVPFEELSNNPIVQKYASILIKRLGSTKAAISPITVTINGNKGAVVFTKNSAFVLTHTAEGGAEIYYFKGGLDLYYNDTKIVADVVVRSRKVGISKLFDKLVQLAQTNESLFGDDSVFSMIVEGRSSATDYSALCQNPEFIAIIKEYLLKTAKSNGKLNVGAAAELMLKSKEKDEQLGSFLSGIGNTLTIRQNIIAPMIGDASNAENNVYDDNGAPVIDIKELGELARKGMGDKITRVQFTLGTVDDIVTEEGVEITLGASGAFDEKTIMEAFKEEEEKYNYNLHLIAVRTKRICEYVQNRGCKQMPKGSFRGMYILGRPGSGKSNTLLTTLKEMNMRENIDYINFGTKSTNFTALYETFYKFNNKLLILDDAANVISGSNRVAFWKTLFNGQPLSNDKSSSEKYYDKTKCVDRREMYYQETGNATKIVKMSDRWQDWENEIIKIKQEMDSKYGTLINPSSSKKEFRGYANPFEYFEKVGFEEEDGLDKSTKDKWKASLDAVYGRQRNAINKAKETSERKMPNEFVFNGCCVVIGNMSEGELAKTVIKEGGEGDYQAVRDRFGGIITIAPPSKVLWSVIKRKLLKDYDSGKSEAEMVIPREKWDEFCKLVEDNLDGVNGPEYNVISWRTVIQAGGNMRISEDDKEWRNLVNGAMLESNAYKSLSPKGNLAVQSMKFSKHGDIIK